MHKHLMRLQSGERVWQSNPRWATKTGAHLRNNLRIIISSLLIKISYAQNYTLAPQSMERNLQISRTFWVHCSSSGSTALTQVIQGRMIQLPDGDTGKLKMCCLCSPRQCHMSQTHLSPDPAPVKNMYWYCFWFGLRAFSLHCWPC